MKITEYPNIKKLNGDNVFIVDGANGTKKVSAENLISSCLDLISPYAKKIMYRCKNLGSVVTPAQYKSISDGTFDDLFIGDYWVINGINWRIIDIDYYYGLGDVACTTHHLVIMPDKAIMTNRKMNASNTTVGGFTGTEFYRNNLTQVNTTIENAFSGHILTYRNLLVTTTSNGMNYATTWFDTKANIPTATNIIGNNLFSAISNGQFIPVNSSIDNRQYTLFALNPSFIPDRSGHYWLRDIANTQQMTCVMINGSIDSAMTSNSFGIRPAFCVRG